MPQRRPLRDIVTDLSCHVFGQGPHIDSDIDQLPTDAYEAIRAEALEACALSPAAEDADLHVALKDIVKTIFVSAAGTIYNRGHIPDYDLFAFLHGRVSAALGNRRMPDWTPEYVVLLDVLDGKPAKYPRNEAAAIDGWLRAWSDRMTEPAVAEMARILGDRRAQLNVPRVQWNTPLFGIGVKKAPICLSFRGDGIGFARILQPPDMAPFLQVVRNPPPGIAPADLFDLAPCESWPLSTLVDSFGSSMPSPFLRDLEPSAFIILVQAIRENWRRGFVDLEIVDSKPVDPRNPRAAAKSFAGMFSGPPPLLRLAYNDAQGQRRAVVISTGQILPPPLPMSGTIEAPAFAVIGPDGAATSYGDLTKLLQGGKLQRHLVQVADEDATRFEAQLLVLQEGLRDLIPKDPEPVIREAVSGMSLG